jgi:hypothetical protein
VVGDPAHVGPVTFGMAGTARALVTGPLATLFVKWAASPKGERAVAAEIAAWERWTGPVPAGTPAVRATRTTAPALIATDAVGGAPSWRWSTPTLDDAVAVLDEMAAHPARQSLADTTVCDPARYADALASRGGPAGAVDDIDTFARSMWRRGERLCHGDAHVENWVIGPAGRPALVDFSHAGGGPAGWDLTFLAVCLDLPTSARVALATRHTSPTQARCMAALLSGKAAGRSPADPFAALLPNALRLREALRGVG